MTTQRTDTFVVGPILEDTMPFLMASPPSSTSLNNLRFMKLLNWDSQQLSLSGILLSDTIFAELGQSRLGLVYLTCHRESEPVINNDVITHQYSFKAYYERSLAYFIGWLSIVNGYLTISDTPSTITLYTSDPSTYIGNPLMVSTMYRIDARINVYSCREAYDNSEVGDGLTETNVPLFEAIDDLLDTDLQDRFTDYNPIFGFMEDSDEEVPETNWCKEVSNTISTNIDIFFIPVYWYNQGSCSTSRLGDSIFGYNSFLPASTYMMQCFAGNFDVYNESPICDRAREYTGYTTRDACLLYSRVGRYFYGPNRNSPDTCGSRVNYYPKLMYYDGSSRAIMNATSTVGTCSQGICRVNDYDKLQCTALDVDPDEVQDTIEEYSTPSDEVEDARTMTRIGIISVAVLIAVVLVVVIILVVVVTRYSSKKSQLSR
jgi:hypothetical protein